MPYKNNLFSMIQRIQSVYLLMAAVIMSFLFLPAFPFASDEAPSDQKGIFADGVFNTYDNIIMLSIISGIILLILINIFLYKNRKSQMLLSRIVIFLILSTIVIGGFLFYQNIDNRQSELSHVNAKLGLFVPIISILLVWFANKYIKKDDKLVRSMDRLR